MSFECKHLRNGHCELLDKPCDPLQKGCVLHKAGAYYIKDDLPAPTKKRETIRKPDHETNR